MTAESPLILAVDDDADTLDAYNLILSKSGFRVRTCYGAQEAQALLETVRPDLIITDLVMETLDSGFVFARRLKEDPRFRAIPIVLITAAGTQRGFDFRPHTADDLAAMHVDAFFDKPGDPKKIVAEIRRLLDAAAHYGAAPDTDDRPPLPRILVADDEPGMREGCRRILEEEGFVVDTAPDGEAALALLRGPGQYAAALVDLKMPRMDGLDLIERLRACDEDLIIFVITAYATIETAVEATRRGAYGYIPKPFTPDELMLPVRNGLERRALALESKRLREEREKRLLELAVERSQSGSIIRCMTDGVVVVNRDGAIVLVNDAMKRIVPAVAALPVSAPADRLQWPELEEVLDTLRRAEAAPAVATRTLVRGPRTFLVNAGPVTDPACVVIGAVAVLRDVSALRKAEAAKSLFMSMMAQEIRGPLQAIEAHLTAIAAGEGRGDLDAERRNLERARVRTQGLLSLVNDIIDLSVWTTATVPVTEAPPTAKP